MQYLWWRDFLDRDLLALAQSSALVNREKFVPTTVSTNEADYRKSMVCWHYAWMPLYESFTNKIRTYLPLIMDDLDIHFDVGTIETQMTTSNEGHYFKVHTDNGTPDTATRKLTFVYYFLLSEHRKFTGGELMLRMPEREIFVEPNHNSIVIFPSHLWHEVRPVQCESQDFLDGRLTLNGWIRHA